MPTFLERQYRRKHLRCVRHITLDPKGRGAVRIHMIPPREDASDAPFLLLLNGASALGVVGSLSVPIQLAMLYWSRKSELSCDRCGSIITSPDVVARVMARLAGGPKAITSSVNMEEWAHQADLYDEIRTGNLWDKTLQVYVTLGLDHPFNAVRVREILKWGESEQYRSLMHNLNANASADRCPNCGKPVEKGWKFCRYCGCKL